MQDQTQKLQDISMVNSPQHDYLQVPLDTSFEDSAFFNTRKESKSFLKNNNLASKGIGESGRSGGMPELMKPKIQITTNVKMYSSAENEGNAEIHPDALMPGRPFTTSLNMINVHGISRKLSRIVNIGGLQKKS